MVPRRPLTVLHAVNLSVHQTKGIRTVPCHPLTAQAAVTLGGGSLCTCATAHGPLPGMVVTVTDVPVRLPRDHTERLEQTQPEPTQHMNMGHEKWAFFGHSVRFDHFYPTPPLLQAPGGALALANCVGRARFSVKALP